MTQGDLEILEAMVLGYALAGEDQHQEVFGSIPFRTWWGPLREYARILQSYPRVSAEDAKSFILLLGLDPEQKGKLMPRIIEALAQEHKLLNVARIPCDLETAAASLRNNPQKKPMHEHLASKIEELEGIKTKLQDALQEYQPIRLAETA